MIYSNYVSTNLNNIGQGTVIYENAVIRHDVIIGRDTIIHPNVVIEPGVVIGNGVEVFPGAYIGKVPKGAGATARTPNFDTFVRIGNNCSIGPNAIIYYDVEIGNNTLIGDGASIREKVRIGSFCIISRYVTINYETVIGDKTKIMDMTHITGKCRVGNDVFISVGVTTTNDNSMGSQGYVEEKIMGPTLHNHVLIGAAANILPGVQIGENTIIAGGAVVSRNIDKNKLAMGIPARVVRDLDD